MGRKHTGYTGERQKSKIEHRVNKRVKENIDNHKNSCRKEPWQNFFFPSVGYNLFYSKILHCREEKRCGWKARGGCRWWACWEYWSTGRRRHPKTARPGARIDALTRSPCCSAGSADTSVSNRKKIIQQKCNNYSNCSVCGKYQAAKRRYHPQ